MSFLILAIIACDTAASTPAPVSNDDISTIIAATFSAAQSQTQAVAPVQPTSASILLPSVTPPVPPTQAPSQNSIAKIGDRVVQGDYALTVTNVEVAQKYSLFSADAGKQFIAVEVLIESNADTGVSVDPLYATIKDSDAYQYNMSAFGKDPALGSQNDLPAGDKMRGWITFEIPQTAHGLIFSYEPLDFNNIHIRVDLGQ